jgi:PAS domain S-box-containing protein
MPISNGKTRASKRHSVRSSDLATGRESNLERDGDLRFRELVDALPMCVVVTDSHGIPKYLNEGARSYTGGAVDDMTLCGALLEIIHPTDREHLSQQWYDSLAGRRKFEIKFRVRGHDGTYRWHLGRGVPLGADGVTGWLLTACDIENQTQIQVEAANQFKHEFLAVASHKLRNPLNAIIGWVNLLQRGNLDDAKSKRALETIERNVYLQVTLIDEILDLSQISQGRAKLTRRTVDLIQVIEDALNVVRSSAEAKGLPMGWEWAGPPIYIHGDHERLQQVISRLVSNSVKFTPTGGRIFLTLECGASEVTLAVKDTGRGIDSEFLPVVFDLFRKAETSAGRGDYGLGLGLAIARKLVELHGGRMEAESEGVNKGATFSLTLPMLAMEARTGDTRTQIDPQARES